VVREVGSSKGKIDKGSGLRSGKIESEVAFGGKQGQKFNRMLSKTSKGQSSKSVSRKANGHRDSGKQDRNLWQWRSMHVVQNSGKGQSSKWATSGKGQWSDTGAQWRQDRNLPTAGQCIVKTRGNNQSSNDGATRNFRQGQSHNHEPGIGKTSPTSAYQ
jgi:hypothetical protein